ncbi:MAG: class I adenylate-forming enzyme family protein [Alphaproteobacteria bacterium]
MNLGTLLTERAQRHSTREAVVCGDQRLSFGELEWRANRLANALIGLGQPPGARVVLFLPNCMELVEAMVAVAKSGGIMVPVNPRLAPEEVRYQIEDTAPFAMIYAPELRGIAREAAGSGAVKMIVNGTAEADETGLQALAETGAETPPDMPAAGENPDAVICYTSGTTGRPKGAVSTHRNLIKGGGEIGSLAWRLSETDRTLVATPMAHRTGIARIVSCICIGSSLVVLPRFDAAEAIRLIEAERVTTIGVVPTIARMLLPEFEKRPDACRTLRTMLATGEVFPPELKARLFAVLPQLGLYSFYSQTEAGLVSCLRPEEQDTHPDSIGKPVQGVEVRIVDASLRDVADGEPGEILVRCGEPGHGTVMSAYYNRPDESAAAFVDGWLRTGDIARRAADGHMYFIDRAKDMIISGGLNIYSAEVEAALARHPAVAAVAVIGVPDEAFGEAVLAYVALKPDSQADADELIEHCRSLIAGYKKPKYVRFRDKLPRNSVGKIAKGELRAEAQSENQPKDQQKARMG